MAIIDNVRNCVLSKKPSRFIAKSIRNLFLPVAMERGQMRTVGIEVSSICNSRCIFCAYKFDYRKKRIMSVDDFKECADSCIELGYENLDLTSLSGELFVHPHAVQIIKLAKKAGFKHIGTYTNAILLHRHDVGSILQSGIDVILISFPGFRAEVYKEIFGVDSFEEFKKSITLLLKAHRDMSSKVQIIFEPRTYLTMNQIEEDAFYQEVIAKYIGKLVFLKEPLRVFDSWGGEIRQSDLIYNMKVDINPLKSIYPLKKPFLCNRIVTISVLANGDVRLCNCRYDSTIETEQDTLYIDNIKNHPSLRGLLDHNRNKISKIRYDFVHGELPTLCKKCPFYVPVKDVIWLDFADKGS